MVALSYGKVFSLDEMRNAEQALKEAGLTKFRSEGRQILAPASEVEKYNATLLQSGSLPSHWAEELEKKLESTNPFMSSTENLRQTREALLGKHLVRMILGSSDFEDADVLWTPLSTSRSRFSKETRMKATIVVKPKAGHEMTTRQIQALRDAVTFAIPDLKATDVTVYDQRKGESYTPDSENEPLSGKRWLCCASRRSSTKSESRTPSRTSLPTSWSPSTSTSIPRSDRSRRRVRYDPKRSLEQTQTEQKKTERYRQQPVQAEPGVKSNQPRALASSPGTSQDRTLQDETDNDDSQPGRRGGLHGGDPGASQGRHGFGAYPRRLLHQGASSLKKPPRSQSKSGGRKNDREDPRRNRAGGEEHRGRRDPDGSRQSRIRNRLRSARTFASRKRPPRSARRRWTRSLR